MHARVRLSILALLIAVLSFGLPPGPLLSPLDGLVVREAEAAITTSPNTLISDPPGELQADGASGVVFGQHGMTPDGRYVLFESLATNFHGGSDTNGLADLFVYDTLSQGLEQITNMPSGTSTGGTAAISADGRWITFTTTAQLIPGDTNTLSDIYLFDRNSDTFTRVSEPPAGGAANDHSGGFVSPLTPDGRYIVFESWATNLVGGADIRGYRDIFRYDRVADTMERVSLRSDGDEPDGNSSVPSISADGRWVAFLSSAQNMEVDPVNSFDDVFLHDMQTGITTQISTKPDGSGPCCASSLAAISGDGATVAYVTTTPNLVPEDVSSNADVFVKDVASGEIQWVSYGMGETVANGNSNSFAMTPSASYVAFASSSTNIVSGDTNNREDVFVHDLETGGTALGSATPGGSFYSLNGSGLGGISDDGSLVAFDTASNAVVQGDTNRKSDVFIRHRGAAFASIPEAQAIQCGEGPDGPGASCQADPVNSLTGAFVNRATDLTLPGIGLPFVFGRTYASNDITEGALGRGWTHPSETSLDFEWDGDVVLRNEIGQKVRFSKRADGTFKPDPGNRSVLSQQGSDYVVTRRGLNELTFNSSGRLTEIADRNGNDIDLAYAGGLLSTITDTVGRTITVSHNAQDKLSSISVGGRSVSYGYAAGLLTSVTDVRGGVTEYEYDGSSRLTKIIDQNDHVAAENTYGAKGRVTSQEDALGKTSSFSWDKRLHTSTMTDAGGKTWKDKYKNSLLARQTDPLGNVTKFTYDEDANVESVVDPRNNTTTMTHGARGNLLTRTAPTPLSYQEVWTYNANNDPLSYEDGRDNTTTFEYDASGDLTTITEPGTVLTQFGRHPTTGQITSVTDPRGKTTTFAYDSEGNLDEVTTPLGNKTTFTQDSAGHVTAMVEPRGNAAGANPNDFDWLFTYDAAGNLLTRTDPLGNVTEWTYDPAGNVSSVEDANSHTTSYGYNAADELTLVTAPGSIETTYGYDDSGNLTSRTDDNNHSTAYEYDDAGRLAAVEDPLGNTWTYGYDTAGNLSAVTDAEGNFTPAGEDGLTTLAYDALNRVTGVDYSSSTPDVTWAYDANSNPTQVTDGLGTETYAYDALNRLDPVTRGSDVFAYDYDNAGNVTKRTYPDGTVVDLVYDDDGRLSTVTSASKTTTYSYDRAGNVTSVDYPNGTTETRTYDRAGRLTEVIHKKGTDVLASFTYTLDPVGNPTQVVTPSETITYDYDDLDRLTEACYQATCTLPTDPFVRYTYDGVGNRLTEVRPTGITTYAYDAADRLTASTGLLPRTYTYDRNGNQTSAGIRSFTWGQDGLLASTTQALETTTYAYDGWGKRASATLGSDATEFTWDVALPLPELVLERDGGGGLKRRYLYGRDLLEMRTGGSDYTYHHDALGSVGLLTDGTGAKISSYLYDPFGTERLVVPSNPSTPDNRMRFTGEYMDPTGLYHLRARQYDSGMGLFLGIDPLPPLLGMPASSTFNYVYGRPTVLVDPAGLRGEWKEECPFLGKLLLVGNWEDAYCEHVLTSEHGAIWRGIVNYGTEALATLAVGKAVPTLFGKAGTLFGRTAYGAPGLLNNNAYFRIGWGWKGTGAVGREVLRISIGGRGQRIWKHIDLWDPWWVGGV